eukprot:6177365-Prymnesium_polylepis.1
MAARALGPGVHVGNQAPAVWSCGAAVLYGIQYLARHGRVVPVSTRPPWGGYIEHATYAIACAGHKPLLSLGELWGRFWRVHCAPSAPFGHR